MDVSPDLLYSILDKDSADKVMRAFSGCRVYFPKSRRLQRDVVRMFRQMGGVDRYERIRRIAEAFEISESTVRRIVRRHRDRD